MNDPVATDEPADSAGADALRGSVEAHCRVGDGYFDSGEYNNAIREYRRALEYSPENAEANYMLAECCGRKGWYIVARALFCRAFRTDAAQVRRLQRRLAETEDAQATLEDTPGSIFVLGCPHSGTTIVSRLLSSHPELMHAHLGESHLFSKSAQQLQDTLREWDVSCREQGKTGWVEKTVGNSFQIPRILHHRPDAFFVVVLRDGRDVTTSMKSRRYAHRDFSEIVDLWLYMNRAILYYLGTERFHLVRYEELVAQPDTTLNDLCLGVGVDYDSSMLEYHRREISWSGQTNARFTLAGGGHDDHGDHDDGHDGFFRKRCR